MRKPVFGILNQVRHKVTATEMDRGLKFRVYIVEGLHYLCSENKGADQLHGDLRLCFRIYKTQVFSCPGSDSKQTIIS